MTIDRPRPLQLSPLGCKHVATLTRLEWLEACGGVNSDSGVRLLCRLSRLTHLSIAQNPDVTAAAYDDLQHLQALRSLNVSGTAMGMVKPAFLDRMRSLAAISMYGLAASQSDVDRVAREYPHVRMAGLEVVEAPVHP